MLRRLNISLALFLISAVATGVNFFDGRISVIDNLNQDEIFGGTKQNQLIVTFTPRGLPNGPDKGDYFVIVDANDNREFMDDNIIKSGKATNGASVRVTVSKSDLSGLADGRYDLAVVIDDNPNNRVDWDGNWDIETESFVLDTTLSITEVAVDPAVFSPNGDGTKDSTTIYYTLSESLFGQYSDLTITIGEGKLAVPAKPVGGKSQGRNTVIWDGKDGLGRYVEDGDYTVVIKAYDAGGNEATASIVVKVRTKGPDVVSPNPAKNQYVSTLLEASAQLKDNSGEGIDLTKSTIRVKDPSGNIVAGVQEDDGINKVVWRLSSPLPGDGSKDGKYTLVITGFDKVGNSTTVSYEFYYDSVFPSITSVTPANGTILTTPPQSIVIVLNDGTGSGPDLATTSKTLKIDNGNIPGTATHNGVDTITFAIMPSTQFAKGVHTIEISPTDFAGNKPMTPFRFQFYYFEKPSDALPEVESVTPADKSFQKFVSKVTAKLKHNISEGIDLNLSTIRLEGPNNVQIPGRQIDDKDRTITWELTNPLPTDGSADGTYTIKVKAIDKLGGTREYTFTFLYDSQPPTLVSIAPESGAIVTTAPTEIVMKVTDGTGSGLDFERTKPTMKLVLEGKEISGIIGKDNSVDTMTFTLPALQTIGKYTTTITLIDRAGNEKSYQAYFDYVHKETDILPEVISVDPSDRSFRNSVQKVSAQLKDNSNKGLDLTTSTIRLENPKGSVVPGVQTDNGKDTIYWELTSPLPADGSADGTYTIKIKAADKAGRSKNYSYTFLYDTQVPVLTYIDPENGSVITGKTITEVVIKVTDGTGSGVDFAYSRASMKLLLDGKEIPNILRKDNGIDTMTFNFPALEATGKYVVEIKLRDRAGNEYTYQSKFDFVEKVTDVLPEILSVDPTDKSFKNSLNKISAALKDNSGKGIDFDASTIRLLGPNNAEVPGYQTTDQKQTINWELINPLPTDGSADGTYTIKVKAIDKSNGVKEFTSTFTYDTRVPTLLSIEPKDGSIVTTKLSEIVAKVSDGTGSGIDFVATRTSMRLSVGGKDIPNIIRTDNGTDTIMFSLPTLEETGKYTIEIKIRDRAGNEYVSITRFDYVSKASDVLPEVTSVDPPNRSFRNSVSQVIATLKDRSTKGIDLEASTIRLIDPKGTEVPGIQTDDKNQTLRWELSKPLPTDGSADGIYTVKVTAVDKAGGKTDFTSTFTYDTIVPWITSITPGNGAILTTSPTEVRIKVSDDSGSGVDFTSSRNSFKLRSTTKEITNISRSDNGIDTLVFVFGKLEDYGKYTAEITLKDNAGNAYTYQSKFDFVKSTTETLPELVSTDPSDRAFRNAISKVSAVLKDNSGKGLDLDASIIRLEDPNGTEVAGFQTNDKNQTISWELQKPLPTDGSADGRYTIKIKGVDKAGNAKEFAVSFLYDTKAPKLLSVEPTDGSILTTPISKIIVKVSDDSGSGLDFTAIRNSMKLMVNNVDVPNISREDNGSDTVTFTFAPLETFGKYTIEIKLKDRAGNEIVHQIKFDYVKKVTQALPEVSSVDPADKSFKNSVTKVSAVLKDKSGKGIDFDLSTIRLFDPNNKQVDGRQIDDGKQTIEWEISPPLPTDGSVDGTYTIKVKVVDNVGAESEELSYQFLYDTTAPSVIKVTPPANSSVYEDITQVSVQLSDGNGSGVDLKGTTVTLQGPKGVVSTSRSDGADNTITLTFAKLTDIGSYTIQVQPKDRAGNVGYTTISKFSYSLKPPAVKSVQLTNRAYIHELNSIEAVLEDRSGIGLDLTETGSTIVVKDPSGKVVQGDQTNNGKDTIIWKPISPLATDGTNDGIYTVTVTPVDSLGNKGQERQYTLIYDTQPPIIVSASPVDINASVTYVGQQITSVQAKLKDQGPAGLEMKDQAIYLEAADGKRVAGVQTDNREDTVVWELNQPLPKDGSADGKYVVVVKAVDKAGSEKEYRYDLIYDTIPPEMVSVSPAHNSTQTKVTTEVSAKLKDNSKIDFQRSSIELRDPDGVSISGLLSNNGTDTIVLTFASLEKSGVYTIRVKAVDRAGNERSYETNFVFKTGLPVVISTTPATFPAEKAYVNQQLREVRVVLQETDGGGIDLSPTGSRIELKGPDGNVVIGSQTTDGIRTLIYTLGKPLATDGSDDGRYTISVVAVNAFKRQDQRKDFTFIYDTRAPEVYWATPPLNVFAETSYVNSQITEIQVKIRDKGPAGVDLDRSTMRLIDPNGKAIEGTVSDDDNETLTLSFPTGLSVEGRYTLSVTPVDKAGNSKPVNISFVYGISVPKVVSTEPVTMPPELAYTNIQVKEVRVTLSETGTSGIDLSPTGCTVELIGPKGKVPGVQTNNGKDTLILTLTKPLLTDGSDDGEYTIAIVPVNSAKLKGSRLEYKFFYDTVPPEVSAQDLSLWYYGEAGNSLGEISAVVKDDQPSSGIDWDNADSSWIKLQDSGGRNVPGEVVVDKDKSEVRLILDVPLASNGTDDGFYTITVAPKDKAGNVTKPALQYRFLYDTKPPKVKKDEITINGIPLLIDPSLEDYPTAVNTKNGVTIVAKMSDDGIGVDLTKSSISIIDPKGNKVSGSMMQDGRETIWITTAQLTEEGKYKVVINPVDLDQNGKNNSSETIYTEFLFETGKPEARILSPGVGSADTESENKPITIKGSATDVAGSANVPASGIAKVEVGGIGPGGKELEWIEAEDDAEARDVNQPKLSRWFVNFLPNESGTYKIKLRVWDKAGNYEIYDTKLELKFTISLSFQGATYCWPNPVVDGLAHISFEVNSPGSQTVNITLYIHDVSGDLVYEKEYPNVQTRKRMNLEWECINSNGSKVATGIYIFRLKAELPDGSETVYKVGKPIVVKN